MAFPIEEQYILDAEKELNLVFPSSFRNKMMIENGGDVFVLDQKDAPGEKELVAILRY